ncbi:MAG: endonuclease/exonuclease/phosphatase family protein [Planctomycetota bacterium]|jgi:endonuclease/exonuclease/phosphatase family metal-dependent hydrolase|nr:endonuclease/exonuclease/phosphatase family protein [Planctomycetota bacterium]
MRLLSWNIHKGIGGIDRRYALERIVTVVQHYHPDVLLLQEVDHGVPRSRHDHQAEKLAEQMNFPHVAFGPNVTLKTGSYGNATLSHYPMTAKENLDLTLPLKKARGALIVDIQVPVNGHQFGLHVANVHLGLAGLERRWQIKKLLQSKRIGSLGKRSRMIIAGDMNDWMGVLPEGRLADEGYVCATGMGKRALRTFPAWSPAGALDKVFLRGPLRCLHSMTSRLALARSASDHLPVILDIELESSSGTEVLQD